MYSVVVLNKNYEYWTEASIRKVLNWFVQGKIEVVVSHETEEIGSVSLRIKVPLIVRLLNFIGYKPKTEEIPFSQEAVFSRDDNFCQYWHKDEHGKKFRFKCNTENRTIDHVIPKRKGGNSNFENCVCACRECNEKIKRGRTPDEAGLELVRKPFVPTRDRNSYVTVRFVFNPQKLSHKVFLKWCKGEIN